MTTMDMRLSRLEERSAQHEVDTAEIKRLVTAVLDKSTLRDEKIIHMQEGIDAMQPSIRVVQDTRAVLRVMKAMLIFFGSAVGFLWGLALWLADHAALVKQLVH